MVNEETCGMFFLNFSNNDPPKKRLVETSLYTTLIKYEEEKGVSINQLNCATNSRPIRTTSLASTSKSSCLLR